MGLLTRELPDPRCLLWCDSSLTGSTRILAYEPALCGFVWFWLARAPSGPTVFPCVFVNITEPQRVSAHNQFKIHVSRIPPFFLQCRPPHGAVGDVLDL